MAQDYAKSRNAPSKAAKKKPAKAATRNNPQDSNHWSWFFSGLFSGLLLCVIGYYSLRQLGENSPLAQDTVDDPPGENSQIGTNLEFYDYLPQAEVEVNVVPVDIAAIAEAEANPTTYLLQAGSFLDPNDAEALRARLILLNLETRIVPANLSGRTWYRVQTGPFVGRASVEAAEKTMIDDNIDPIRMRIPGP